MLDDFGASTGAVCQHTYPTGLVTADEQATAPDVYPLAVDGCQRSYARGMYRAEGPMDVLSPKEAGLRDRTTARGAPFMERAVLGV